MLEGSKVCFVMCLTPKLTPLESQNIRKKPLDLDSHVRENSLHSEMGRKLKSQGTQKYNPCSQLTQFITYVFFPSPSQHKLFPSHSQHKFSVSYESHITCIFLSYDTGYILFLSPIQHVFLNIMIKDVSPSQVMIICESQSTQIIL